MSATLLPFPRRPLQRLRVFKRGRTWFCLGKLYCGVGSTPRASIRNWADGTPKAPV